jgi:hypothetical protein
MLILVILLGVLAIGLISFIAGQLWEQKNTKRLLQPSNSDINRRARSRRRIEKDLDQLLSLYQEGLLSEEKYLRLADQLIDQLAALLPLDIAAAR